MITSTIKIKLTCDINTLWSILTDIQNYDWRSNLDHTEIIHNLDFIEVDKNGNKTYFYTTKINKPYCWEFDMDNTNMSGHWIGKLIENGQYTNIEFTEMISVKKKYLKPFTKLFLKHQQKLFIKDLTKKLSQNTCN